MEAKYSYFNLKNIVEFGLKTNEGYMIQQIIF